MIAGVPYDAEVEYLESSGTQYIDTGVCPSVSTVWRMRCAPAASSCIMGCMNAAARRFQVTQIYGGNVARAYVGVGSSSYPSFVELGRISLNQFHDYEINAAEGMVAMDGVSQPYPYNHAALPTAVSMWLFGSNSDNESYKRVASAKIASATYIQDGVVVRDFIPVRVGAAGYLYDRVSRRLFGDGSLVPGPDVAIPVMGVHCYASPRVVLPEGARRLAYLESDGAQWIDTGFKANTTTTKFECGIVPLNLSVRQGLFGSRIVNIANVQSCNAFVVSNSGGCLRLDWAAGSNNPYVPAAIGIAYELSVTRGVAVVNGDNKRLDFVYEGSVDQSDNFLVGNFSNGALPYSRGFIGRWLWARLYSHDLLIRDLIPIAIGNTGYMYDAVNEVLYPNKGTGSFVLGELGGAS